MKSSNWHKKSSFGETKVFIFLLAWCWLFLLFPLFYLELMFTLPSPTSLFVLNHSRENSELQKKIRNSREKVDLMDIDIACRLLLPFFNSPRCFYLSSINSEVCSTLDSFASYFFSSQINEKFIRRMALTTSTERKNKKSFFFRGDEIECS